MNRTLVYRIAFALLSVVFFTGCKKKETTSAVRKDIQHAVFASGYVTYENEYVVSTSVSGILQEIFVTEGDHVAKNQSIASIKSDVQNNQLRDAEVVRNDAQNNASNSSAQLAQIQAQINQAHNQLMQDEKNWKRYQELRSKNSVSQLDLEKAALQYEASKNNWVALQKKYDEAQNSLKLSAQRSQIQVASQNAVLNDFKIKSDNASTVIQVNKTKGELIRPGETLATLGSGMFIIKMYVSEDDIVKVNLGQVVAVQLNTEPDTTYGARVSKIYPGFDEANQSYIVEATFTTLPNKLFSNTQLQANIETGTQQNVLVIPADYITKGKFVTLENGEQREVKIGSRDAKWAEIISGISENDKLIKP